MGRGGKAFETAHRPDVQDPEGFSKQDDEQQSAQQRLIGILILTVQHFFGSFPHLFAGVTDLRNPNKVTYPLASLAFSGVMIFLCRIGARRQVGLLLRNGSSIAKFQTLFGVDSFPHGDTMDDAYAKLDPDQLQDVVSSMTDTLIRQKVLYPYRLLERFFVVAVDGTGIVTYHQRHCAHCLTRTRNGTTLYYHNVLEAKLVTTNGFAFSLMSEFIENSGQNLTKQDCELRAFCRLAKRLKKRFPRLPILLSMDGLFAGGPTFSLCRDYGWKFMIVLKDDDLPAINEEFTAIAKLQTEHQCMVNIGKNAEIKQAFRWVDDIAYVDSIHREHDVSVIECLETKPDTEGKEKTTKFKWVTNTKISAKNVVTLANQGGRIRWKIENEGFNVQKNGGYDLEHAYTTDETSAKVFYFLLQIAHILAQLIEKGSLFKRVFPAGFGSSKNLSFFLLEAWRNARSAQQVITTALRARLQIRFSFDSS
jgi:hypothetical protein